MIFQGSSFTYVESGMPSSSCGVSCGAQTAHGFSHPCRENWLPMALPFNETQWSLPSATRRVSWTVSTACTPGIVNLPPSQVGLHTCQEILVRAVAAYVCLECHRQARRSTFAQKKKTLQPTTPGWLRTAGQGQRWLLSSFPPFLFYFLN